jgi:hypothetical protein
VNAEAPPRITRRRALCGALIALAALVPCALARAGSQQFSSYFLRPEKPKGTVVDPANITFFYLNVDLTVSRRDAGALASATLESSIRGQHAGQITSGNDPDPIRPRFGLPALATMPGTPMAVGVGSSRTDKIQFSFPRRTDFPTTFNAKNRLLFGGKFSVPGRQSVSKLTFNNAQWGLNDNTEVQVALGTSTFGFANGSFHFVYQNSSNDSVVLASLQFESHMTELDLGSLEPGPSSLGGLPLAPDVVVRSDGGSDPAAPLAPGATIDFGFSGNFPPFLVVQGNVIQGSEELPFALEYQDVPEPSSLLVAAIALSLGWGMSRGRKSMSSHS